MYFGKSQNAILICAPAIIRILYRKDVDVGFVFRTGSDGLQKRGYRDPFANRLNSTQDPPSDRPPEYPSLRKTPQVAQ
jgi:hypothetical protein